MYDDEVDSYGCRWRWAILSLQCMGHERVHGTDMLNSIQCTLIAPSHAMGIYTILFCSPQPSHARVRSSSIAASQETTNKVTRQLRLRILLLPEVLEHMRQLFPVIECFLELHMRLRDQHIHRLQLLHVSVPLKLLPYLCADRRDGQVERVH